MSYGDVCVRLCVPAVDDVLADLEKVCRMIATETYSSATSSAITSLSFHMKMMGHQLEGICKGNCPLSSVQTQPCSRRGGDVWPCSVSYRQNTTYAFSPSC